MINLFLKIEHSRDSDLLCNIQESQQYISNSEAQNLTMTYFPLTTTGLTITKLLWYEQTSNTGGQEYHLNLCYFSVIFTNWDTVYFGTKLETNIKGIGGKS